MRTKKQIEDKIAELRKQTSLQMKNHLDDKTGSEIYLRIYNKIQDKILTLEWVLKIHKDC